MLKPEKTTPSIFKKFEKRKVVFWYNKDWNNLHSKGVTMGPKE
jgi:hypothetical protein